MATIKSFTSVEQSKKLEEILSLESADMYYPWYIEDDGDTIESGYRITTPNVGNFITHKINKMILPCWSLAALLGIVCEVKRMDYSDKWEAASWNKSSTEQEYYVDVEGYDNPVDACVALIEKLHELNLL